MAGNGSRLTPKQRALIVSLLCERTIEDAATVAHVSPRTAYRWLKDLRFQTALDRAQQQTVQDGLNRLRLSLGKAVNKLYDLMNGGNTEAIALRAAVALLDYGTKAVETCDLLTRLAALEQLLTLRGRTS